MEEERPPDSGPTPELSDPPVGAAVERATSRTSGAVLDRIAELEGREYALDTQLVTVRADLDRLRRQLDQDLTLTTEPALLDVPTPVIAVAPVASATEHASAPVTELLPQAAPGAHGATSLPAASEIDHLIQEAVASRDRDTASPGRPSGLPADAAASDILTGSDGTPMPAHQQAASSDDEQNPGVGGIDDFFLRPGSSRKGRN